VDLLPQKHEQLKGIIKGKGIIFGDIILSSGLKSHFYYDIKNIVNSEGVVLIGELMLSKIRELFGSGIKSVGGLESGAIPITTAIVLVRNQLCEGEGKLTGFFVRKETRKHGLQKKIEGLPKKPLIVVDDVVTTGQSVIDAVNALIEDDIPPMGIISVIDRQDKRNLLTNGKLKFDSLFKHSEFEDFIKMKEEELKTR
jgi:orotate phosphoribosyltransferase